MVGVWLAACIALMPGPGGPTPQRQHALEPSQPNSAALRSRSYSCSVSAGKARWLPGTEQVLLGKDDNRLLFDATTGQVLRRLQSGEPFPVPERRRRKQVISADGEWSCSVEGGMLDLAQGAAPHSLDVCRISTIKGRARHGLGWRPRWCQVVGQHILAIDETERRACLVSFEDHAVQFREFRTRHRIADFQAFGSGVACISSDGWFSQFELDGDGFRFEERRLWEIDIRAPRLRPNGRAVLALGQTAGVRLFDTTTGALLWSRREFKDFRAKQIGCVAANFAVLFTNRAALCVDLGTGEERWRVTDERERKASFAYSDACSRIAVAGPGGRIAFFDEESLEFDSVLLAENEFASGLYFLSSDLFACLIEQPAGSRLRVVSLERDCEVVAEFTLPEVDYRRPNLVPLENGAAALVASGVECSLLTANAEGAVGLKRLPIAAPIRASAAHTGVVIEDEEGSLTYFDLDGIPLWNHADTEGGVHSFDASGSTWGLDTLREALVGTGGGEESMLFVFPCMDDEPCSSRLRVSESQQLLIYAREGEETFWCWDYQQQVMKWRAPRSWYHDNFDFGGADDSLLLWSLEVCDAKTGEHLWNWPVLRNAVLTAAGPERAELVDRTGGFVAIDLETRRVLAHAQLFEDGSLLAYSNGNLHIEAGAATRSLK